MWKICINYDTGGGRLGGHCTQAAFTGLPGVEIAAMSDVNPETVLKDDSPIGAKRLYHSYTEMLEQEKPDIVVLCSRLPGEHYEQIKFALNHGCHVLCEKPLAETLEQVEELTELSRKTGKLVQIAHLARFAPAFHEMKRLITAGEIGDILTCYMRGKEDHRGGGEDMLVLGTHILDIACWLFGRPEQVYSDMRYKGNLLTVNDTIQTVEPIGPCGSDEIFSHYRFANGINGIFESRHHLVPGGEARLGITVAGTKGTLCIRYSGDRTLRISRDFPVPVEDQTTFEIVPLPGPPEIPGAAPIDLTKNWGYDTSRYIFRYFAENNRRAAWNLLQAIEGKETLLAGVETAADSLEMMVGAYQSALNHAVVTFPLKDKKHPLKQEA
ncbi:MAG: Gfo/Idh/MocA family oxidoreductase [Lentisphaeria bacterium]|nr:Gfo/Idh/MocA family oxidoreductase [Lentisphaeria bacterium]